ncbi:DUF6766 family protein [Streptomyces gardneri]|uniref:DUF6766 family protein n=1 Tax=Streptomyces gardneri TaxID=66892 RepID=UPI00369388F1
MRSNCASSRTRSAGPRTASAEFWNRTLQNRQSELLAAASMVVLSFHLRQRGSPESKPVGAAHTSSGVEGRRPTARERSGWTPDGRPRRGAG